MRASSEARAVLLTLWYNRTSSFPRRQALGRARGGGAIDVRSRIHGWTTGAIIHELEDEVRVLLLMGLGSTGAPSLTRAMHMLEDAHPRFIVVAVGCHAQIKVQNSPQYRALLLEMLACEQLMRSVQMDSASDITYEGGGG